LLTQPNAEGGVLFEQLEDLPRAFAQQPIDLGRFVDPSKAGRNLEDERIEVARDEVEEAVLRIEIQVVTSHPVAPALEVLRSVALEQCGVFAPGRSLEMDEHALVAVVRLVTPFAGSKAEIDVIETVRERCVEPPELLEDGPSNQHASGGDRL
jgi:hypothetical protein